MGWARLIRAKPPDALGATMVSITAGTASVCPRRERSPRGFRRDTLADCILSWVCKHPLELRGRLDEFNARQVRSRRLRNFLAGDRSVHHFPQQRFQSHVVTWLKIFLPLSRFSNLQPLVAPATTGRCHAPGPPPRPYFCHCRSAGRTLLLTLLAHQNPPPTLEIFWGIFVKRSEERRV